MSEMKISLCNRDTKHVWLDFFQNIETKWPGFTKNLNITLKMKIFMYSCMKNSYDNMEKMNINF